MGLTHPAPLVDFFVIGVQKGGTTALDAYLRESGAVQMARRKEVHFFDDETADWSRPCLDPLHSQFTWDASQPRGESTPIYSYWPGALERLRRYNPRARLVLLLRQPAYRAYSHWRMETERGAETLAFEDAVGPKGSERMRAAPGGVHRVHSYVERGLYAPQLRRVFALFPRDQVLVLRTDDLWEQPAPVVSRVLRFVGGVAGAEAERRYIVPAYPREAPRAPPAQADMLLRLTRRFEADIRQSAELAGLSLDDWLDPAYREPMPR